MKKIKTVLICLLISSRLLASDIYEEVSSAIRNGDSHQLATYFNSSIDLSITGSENVYSKAQAEFIVKDFFNKNPPKSFNILHKGSSPEGTQYLIGNLITTNGKTFRTSFYIKTTKGVQALQELRIEVE